MRKRSLFAGSAAAVLVCLCSATAASASQVVVDPLATVGAGSSPRSIAVGPNGEFYTANYGLGSVTGFTADGSFLPDSSTTLGLNSQPSAIARDSQGALWVATANAPFISRHMPGDPSSSSYSLGGAARPGAVTIDKSDTVYTVDSAGDSVWDVTQSAGTISPIQKFATLAVDALPKGIVTDSVGNIYTANSGTSTVSMITPGGTVTDNFVELSPGDGPDAITIDSLGMLYVANYTAGTVVKIDSTKPAGMNVVGTFTLPTDARPLGIAVDSRDNVYVSDSGPNTVSMIPAGSNGAPLTILTLASNAGASGIAVSSTNQLLVTGFGTGTVTSLDLSTVITSSSYSVATVGTSFSSTLAATGVDPVTFAATGLPSWLQLDPSGVLTGTPTAGGTYSFSVVATSPVGSSAPQTYTLAVAAANTPGTGGAGGTGPGSGTASAGGGGGTGANGGTATTSLAHTGASESMVFGFGGAAAAVVIAGLGLTMARRRLFSRHCSR